MVILLKEGEKENFWNLENFSVIKLRNIVENNEKVQYNQCKFYMNKNNDGATFQYEGYL